MASDGTCSNSNLLQQPWRRKNTALTLTEINERKAFSEGNNN